MLSDGNYLYLLNQTSVVTQLAPAGSASAPSYAFLPDPATGMYLVNPSQLGFAAGGVNVATIDTTGGTGNYITTFVGRVQADLITGGTF